MRYINQDDKLYRIIVNGTVPKALLLCYKKNTYLQ